MAASARRIMSSIGGVQGLVLWLIVEHWPKELSRAGIAFALVTFLLVSALVLHFARSGEKLRRLVALAAGTAGVFALIALWVGWPFPLTAARYHGDEQRVWTFVFASGIAIYVLGPFVQIFQRSGRRVFPYPDLYRHAWNNLFIAALGGLYLGAVWVLLLLWGSLFDLVGIESFHNLFQKRPFVFAVTGAALGYGVAVGHESHRVIATLRSLTQALFRAIEPMLAAVTLGFLATLPFTGLESLFAADSAATIVMGWVAVHVVFLNAVYLDGSERPPYAPLVRCLVEAGTLAAPALAAIAIYAVALRVGQHGLTPERVFALVISTVLTLYALGYAAAVVLRGEPWLPRLRQVNVALAWVVIALAILLHTPLLDPPRLSLRSQLDRLARGAVSPENFDYAFLRFKLGQAGYTALEKLSADGVSATYVARALSIDNYSQWTEKDPGGTSALVFKPLPADSVLPDLLIWGLKRSLATLAYCEVSRPCVVVGVDLDGDGAAEYVLSQSHGPRINYVLALDATRGVWQAVGQLRVPQELVRWDGWREALATGRAVIVPSRYGDVEVDGQRLRFSADP
jgi:hypothetical protein